MYKNLKPNNYRPRIVDALLQELLDEFGAVEVRGPKYCGKTWTSLAFARSVTHVDDLSLRDLIVAEPKIALRGETPVAIDEWQEVPQIWDSARRIIDETGAKPGQFIFTGSSTPNKEKVVHSGAGRIATLPMSTMTLYEKGVVDGGVSLSDLFNGKFEVVKSDKDLEFYAEQIITGGWPSLLNGSKKKSKHLAMQYLNATFETSIPAKGASSSTALAIARSLAKNVGTSAKLSNIASDSSIAETTDATRFKVSEYINIFKSFYLLQELQGWDAPLRSKSRLRTKPKRYFCDPSLAAALLGTDNKRLLLDAQLFGILFESLCVHDLEVFARALPGAAQNPIFYYRDSDGLEVDVIIELLDGRWAGIEIKLGQEKVKKGCASLNRLRKKIERNPLAQNKEPEFMAVLTATSKIAYYDKEEDVFVIPFACLEP